MISFIILTNLFIGWRSSLAHPSSVPARWHSEQCHPRPDECFNTTFPDKYDRRIIFITLRDPIDRFVSTNQWTLSKPFRGKEINERHQEVYNRYQPNPTASIAESLCTIQKDTIQLHQQVIDDIQQLQHWFTIEHWLGETFYPRVYDWREHSSRLYPLVSERGYDLIAQEDTAILQVSDRTDVHQPFFRDAEDFELRKKKIKFCLEEFWKLKKIIFILEI